MKFKVFFFLVLVFRLNQQRTELSELKGKKKTEKKKPKPKQKKKKKMKC